MRGAWLLQTALMSGQTGRTTGGYCGGKYVQDVSACRDEAIHAVVLLALLCTTIISILCAFAFFREDKEEQITPLCPQLVVKEDDLKLRLPREDAGEGTLIKDQAGRVRCKAITDWPDPFRPSASGVAATVRLHNELGDLLATVVARNLAVPGQGLALCKSGCEIFGFIEAEPPLQPKRYIVRHRSGMHLLTLIGDFGAMDVDAINPAGTVVCSYKQVGDEFAARVCQHVDAGLMLCALLAILVHRQLTVVAPCQPVPIGRPALAQLSMCDSPASAAREAEGESPQEGRDPHPEPAPTGDTIVAEQAASAPAVPEDTPAEAANLVIGADSTGAMAAPPVSRGQMVEDDPVAPRTSAEAAPGEAKAGSFTA